MADTWGVWSPFSLGPQVPLLSLLEGVTGSPTRPLQHRTIKSHPTQALGVDLVSVPSLALAVNAPHLPTPTRNGICACSMVGLPDRSSSHLHTTPQHPEGLRQCPFLSPNPDGSGTWGSKHLLEVKLDSTLQVCKQQTNHMCMHSTSGRRSKEHNAFPGPGTQAGSGARAMAQCVAQGG